MGALSSMSLGATEGRVARFWESLYCYSDSLGDHSHSEGARVLSEGYILPDEEANVLDNLDVQSFSELADKALSNILVKDLGGEGDMVEMVSAINSSKLDSRSLIIHLTEYVEALKEFPADE